MAAADPRAGALVVRAFALEDLEIDADIDPRDGVVVSAVWTDVDAAVVRGGGEG
jgi:hypothetical protein